MDVSRLAATGWTARTPLEQGLTEVYAWFLDQARKGEIAASPPER